MKEQKSREGEIYYYFFMVFVILISPEGVIVNVKNGIRSDNFFSKIQ